MGNSSSNQSRPQTGGHKNLYKLMRAPTQYSEINTINFNRNDLANTLSDRSIIDRIHHGGAGLKRIPKRNRYSEYETQKIRNKNENLIGGNHYSTVSDSEMSALRNLIKYQNGGGCGCGENTVLKGGNNVLTGGCSCGNDARVLKGGMINSATSSASVYGNMDLSATSYDNNVGFSATSLLQGGSATSSASVYGNAADLSATSVTLQGGSATSSASVYGNAADLSATSVTLQGGSATSSASVYGNIADLSATSVSLQQGGLSATSTLQQGGLSATSTLQQEGLSATSTLQQGGLSATSAMSNGMSNNNVDSAMQRLTRLANIQFGGYESYFGNINSTSDLISAFSQSSVSSSQPIDYANIMGGAWGKKKTQKGGNDEKDIDDSSSSTTETESKSSSTSIKEEKTEKTEQSEQSRIEKLKQQPRERSRKASSTSSSGSTNSSSISGSTDSTTTSDSSLYSATTGTLGRNNVYLSTTMSDGNFIDAKQFYSSENGELYSSDTNYLRHNLTKRRFK
jgi:hypothetical protein